MARAQHDNYRYVSMKKRGDGGRRLDIIIPYNTKYAIILRDAKLQSVCVGNIVKAMNEFTYMHEHTYRNKYHLYVL